MFDLKETMTSEKEEEGEISLKVKRLGGKQANALKRLLTLNIHHRPKGSIPGEQNFFYYDTRTLKWQKIATDESCVGKHTYKRV